MLRSLALVFLSLVSLASARELYPGQWASIDPATGEWFRSQRNPTTKVPCCSEADGSYVEEDIRDGHYWVRFDRTGGEWREVPDEIVIRDPNRNGAPVVWFYYEVRVGSSVLKFRCYAPGAGL
jgi:hypothetical protein